MSRRAGRDLSILSTLNLTLEDHHGKSYRTLRSDRKLRAQHAGHRRLRRRRPAHRRGQPPALPQHRRDGGRRARPTRVKLPDGSPAKVVWAPMLVDGETQADIVAQQFQDAGVNVLVCAPDTWAFPQLSVISLLSAVPGRHADQHHLRQQRPQAGRGLRPRRQRRARPVRPAVAPERRHLARHRPEPEDDRRHRRRAGRLVLRGRDHAGAQGPPRRHLRPRLDGHGDGPGARHPHPQARSASRSPGWT